MGRIGRALGERLNVSTDTLRALTNEPVPNHLKRWWFALGGTPAYLFVVQIVTGILLAVYYEPTPAAAYDSVAYITSSASYGWYVRSLHKWSATMMIAAVILHQMRVFFTGAYRKPRDINWMVGVFLLICTLMLGFTGYSLVYEQLSYWGATVGSNILDLVPIVGRAMKRMLLAGDVYNERTLSRLYVLHAAVLPTALVLLVSVHIAIIRLQGVTEFHFEKDGREDTGHFNFFPDHLLTELAIGLALMIVLSALATALPATLGPRANPLVTPEIIKPEWFFYVSFRWLKLFSGTLAVLSMGFIVSVILFWPFVDRAIARFTRGRETSVWIGTLGVLALVGLTVWEAAVAH